MGIASLLQPEKPREKSVFYSFLFLALKDYISAKKAIASVKAKPRMKLKSLIRQLLQLNNLAYWRKPQSKQSHASPLQSRSSSLPLRALSLPLPIGIGTLLYLSLLPVFPARL